MSAIRSPPARGSRSSSLAWHDPSAAQARYERLFHRRPDQRRPHRQVLSDVALDVSGRPFQLITAPLRPSLLAEQVHGGRRGGPGRRRRPRRADDWCDDLVGALLQPHVLAVAPRVLSPGGQVVDLGLVRSGEELVPLVNGLSTPDSAFGSFEWCRDVDAVSGRCWAVRRRDLELLDSEPLRPSPTPPPPPGGCAWSGATTTFTITGTAMAPTRFFNPQLDRTGGALVPGKGFDGAFSSDRRVMW